MTISQTEVFTKKCVEARVLGYFSGYVRITHEKT
jgi:hypothetical protein